MTMAESSPKDIFGLEGIASEATDTEVGAQWLRQYFMLPYNPFPPSGISPDVPEAPPLRNQEGQEIDLLIRGFIMSAYRDRAATQGLVVIGTYGTGKSHLLQLVHNQISRYLGSGEEKALSIYVQRPRVEAQDLNREILRSLGEDTVRKMLWYCIRKEIAEDIQNQPDVLKGLQGKLEGPIFVQRGKLDDKSAIAQVFRVDNLEDYRKFFEAYDVQGWSREALRDWLRDLFVRSVQTQSPLEVVDSFIALT